MNYGKLNFLSQKVQLRVGSGLVCTYMEILHLGRAAYHRRLAVGLIFNAASLIHCSFENRLENNITPFKVPQSRKLGDSQKKGLELVQ